MSGERSGHDRLKKAAEKGELSEMIEVSADLSGLNCAARSYIVKPFHQFLHQLVGKDKEGGEDTEADCKTVHEILRMF